MPAELDWAQLLEDRPDVLREYQEESTRDAKSKKYLYDLGILTAEDFAEWWYNQYGKNEGYTQTPASNPGTPTTPPAEQLPPPVTQTPVPSEITPEGQTPGPNQLPPIVADPTPGTGAQQPGTGLGTGADTTSPYMTRDQAFQQAIARAKLATMSRGVSWDDYDDEMIAYLSDIANLIPEGDKNPGSYFDPSFGEAFLSGKEAQQRNQYRNYVTRSLSRGNTNYSQLDGVISKILGESSQEAEAMLERGAKRGQFNERGVEGGKNKLEMAKQKARAKLQGYSNDVISKYESDFSDIYDRALGAANNYKLGDNFDLSPYASEFDRVTQRMSQNAEGDFYSLLGDEPLIDPNVIRMGAGTAQGAVNLRDIDVMESLSRRKKASEAGRGLGSQGAF